MLRERLILDRYIEASRATHLGITQRCDDRAEIVGLNPHVTVANDQEFVFRLVHHPYQLGYLVIDGAAPGAIQNPNLAFRKILDQLLKYGHRRVVFITRTENQFIVWIVLPAKAGVILVGVGV